jgi:hypothetical protein
MRGPVASKIEELRESVRNLSAIHASLTPKHCGWAVCECRLAQRLREVSEQIGKLLARKKRRAS